MAHTARIPNNLHDVSPLGASEYFVACTPDDSTDLAAGPNGVYPRAIRVGGAGNLALVRVDGTAVTITGVVAGETLCIRASKVKSTGTTATNITLLY